MPPLIKHTRHESDEIQSIHDPSKEEIESTAAAADFKPTIVWRNVVIMGYLHAAAAYGLYLCFTSAMIKTSILGESLVLRLDMSPLLTGSSRHPFSTSCKPDDDIDSISDVCGRGTGNHGRSSSSLVP